jgi:hypothetical protein
MSETLDAERLPGPVEAPPQTSADQWRQLLAIDVERLGQLSRDPRIDKALRAELRPLLWQVWQTLSPPTETEEEAQDELGQGSEGEEPGAPEDSEASAESAGASPPRASELRALADRCTEALRRCGDDRGAGAWRIGQMRIHRPFADRVVVPPSARQTDQLAQRVARHFKARLALTEARLKWFEDRANSQAPTSVAQVRQPDGDKDRLGLELLRKRGTSRYS